MERVPNDEPPASNYAPPEEAKRAFLQESTIVIRIHDNPFDVGSIIPRQDVEQLKKQSFSICTAAGTILFTAREEPVPFAQAVADGLDRISLEVRDSSGEMVLCMAMTGGVFPRWTDVKKGPELRLETSHGRPLGSVRAPFKLGRRLSIYDADGQAAAVIKPVSFLLLFQRPNTFKVYKERVELAKIIKRQAGIVAKSQDITFAEPRSDDVNLNWLILAAAFLILYGDI